MFTTDDPEEGEAFVVARRMAIPAVERTGTLLLEDVGVPLPQLGALVDGIAAISAEREVTIAVIAHAGDGNTHPLIVFDPARRRHGRARAQTAYGEVMDLAISLGGTITGEHGVGRLKRPWLRDYLGDDVMALNQRIKDALDPQGILNPGRPMLWPWSRSSARPSKRSPGWQSSAWQTAVRVAEPLPPWRAGSSARSGSRWSRRSPRPAR